MGAGTAGGGGADEQLGRQLNQRRRGIEKPLALQHHIDMAQGNAAAQLVAIGVEAAADRRGQAAKAAAGIAVQDRLAIELPAGSGEDGD